MSWRNRTRTCPLSTEHWRRTRKTLLTTWSIPSLWKKRSWTSWKSNWRVSSGQQNRTEKPWIFSRDIRCRSCRSRSANLLYKAWHRVRQSQNLCVWYFFITTRTTGGLRNYRSVFVWQQSSGYQCFTSEGTRNVNIYWARVYAAAETMQSCCLKFGWLFQKVLKKKTKMCGQMWSKQAHKSSSTLPSSPQRQRLRSRRLRRFSWCSSCSTWSLWRSSWTVRMRSTKLPSTTWRFKQCWIRKSNVYAKISTTDPAP